MGSDIWPNTTSLLQILFGSSKRNNEIIFECLFDTKHTNIVWTTFVLIKIQDCAKNIEKQKKQTLQKLNGIITINIHFKPIVKFMLHILPQDQPHGQLPKTDIMKDTMTDQ